MNKYQYMRTIRFRLHPKGNEGISIPVADKVLLQELVEKLENAQIAIANLFFYEKKEAGKKVKKIRNRLEVKKDWLSLYHKHEFISFTKSYSKKKYKLSNLGYFEKQLMQSLNEFNIHIEQLRDAVSRKEESKQKRAEIAFSVRALLSKNIMCYLADLISKQNLSSGNDFLLDKQRDELESKLSEIKQDLKNLEIELLPSQSSGLEIACGSFNYFTVNKKSKEYFDNKIDNIEKEQKSFYAKVDSYKLQNGSQNIIHDFKTEQEKQWIDEYIKKNDINVKSLTISQTKILLANFKSDQKSIFNEVLDHTVSKDSEREYVTNNEKLSVGEAQIKYRSIKALSDLNEQFSLFALESQKKDASNEILFKDLINLHKEKKSKKKFTFGKYAKFENYKNYCKEFSEISKEAGQLTSRINNLKKQKIDSQRATYWGMLYKESDKVKLLLIPRKKIVSARTKINSFTPDDKGNLYMLNSLTFRALKKLCFAEESTFISEMDNDEIKKKYGQEVITLRKLQEQIKETVTIPQKKEDKTQSQKMIEKQNMQLEFYKKVLFSQYAKDRLDLPYDLTKCSFATDLRQFERELETACYQLQAYKMSNDQLDTFVNDFNVIVYDVTSYDLESRNKSSDDRKFTKIWNQFWRQNIDSEYGLIRLNPEFKINFRKKDYEVDQFFFEKKFPDKFQNRFLKEQHTATFTFALQAGNIYEDLSLSKPEKLINKINQFNEHFIQQKQYDSAWKYGIDVGQIELATLCITRKTDQLYSVNNELKYKYEFPEISVYKLNDLNYFETYQTKSEPGKIKNRYAIKNVSYFIDNEELFDRSTTGAIDLSTAKLIKDKIVINSDLISYLKLQKLVSKKRIYEIFHRDHKDFQESFIIEISKNKYDRKGCQETSDKHVNVIFEKKDKEQQGRTVFTFKEEWEQVIEYTTDDIFNSLNSYLRDLQMLQRQRKNSNQLDQEIRFENVHTPTHEQINNLRNALVANMVGIICHLQKNYPGYVFLEDLKKDQVQNQFEQSNLYIARKLEFALYKKFQTLGLVPPHIKDIVSLRELTRKTIKDENKVNIFNSQFGAIVFVDENQTSNVCPYCDRIAKKNKDYKFKQHRYCCDPEGEKLTTCDFDTKKIKDEIKWLKSIDNPDSLAAFNVARKIDTKDKICKLEINETKKQNNKQKKK